MGCRKRTGKIAPEIGFSYRGNTLTIIPVTVLSSYIFRQIWGLALAIAIGLSLLVLLTQSLRFLDLMIAAGAAPGVFFQLMGLSLPRLIEIILPIALGAGVLLVGLKLHGDHELTVMQATGSTPWRLTRPVIATIFLGTILSGTLSLWLTPMALATLQSSRQTIEAQFSLSLLQPGVFNFFGNNIMVYFDKRDNEGKLVNLILHDQRDPLHPYTLLAETGELASDGNQFRLNITNGRRQQLNAQRGIVDQLSFTRYGIELPKMIRDIAPRWKEPNERTITELLSPTYNALDAAKRDELRAELHRRFSSLFLPFSMALPILLMVLRTIRPREGGLRPTMIGLAYIGLMETLLLLLNAAITDQPSLTPLLYIVALAPGLAALWVLRPRAMPPVIPEGAVAA